MIQSLFTFIRRARSTSYRSAPSARARRAGEQSTTALEQGDLAAIDVALAEWEAIAARGHDDDASSAALYRGALRLARYDRAGDAADLERACAILAEATQAETDPESPLLPYHHGIALLRRFERGGRMADLEQGIAAMRHVLTLVVDGIRIEGAARSMLGAMLMRRAESTGSIADLDAAVAAHRLAVTADAKPADLALRLTNLGTAYSERFEAAGNVDDLDEAERCYQEARDLAPSSTVAVGGLARLWRARYRLSANIQWLDRAITAYRTLSEASDSPLAVALVHNNLSAALRDRYLARGDSSDLDAAIEASRRALAVAPAGYLQRPMWLENLANHLRVRAMRTGSAEDRRAAIAAYEEAIAHAPEGSDVWRTAPMNLGALLTDVDETDRALELLEVGFARATAAAANVDIVEGARSLALVHAHGRRWARAGEVLVAGIGALERLQRAQLSSGAKRLWLEKAGDVHLLAAEMFLRAGDAAEALAAIERGRARLLAEVLGRDRAALAALERTGDQRLVERYRTAVGQVRLLTAAAERDTRSRPAVVAAMQSLEAIAEDVRQATGDVAFSRPWTVEDIVDAARAASAPLVYIVPLSELGVVIIVKGEPAEIRAIALPAVTTAQVDQVVERYVTAYRGSVESAESAAWERWESSLDETTQWCWEACMRDVVAALGDAHEAVLVPVGRLGRLPLHVAAGGGSSALDAAIWRQSPNARSLSQLPPVDAESLLTVTFADEEEPLPAIGVEMAAVRRAFSTVRALDGEAATVAAVFDEIRHATALHFACHATAGGDDAHAGGLVLADGSVSLQELFDVRLADGALVVLSACETGVIGERLPDEALSLASGMLQAGASAVVSSLWSVPDASTAILMSRFYYLWRERRQAPAAALRDAQRWMRDSSNGEIATFLRVNLPHELIDDLAKALEREAGGAMFRHCVHWGAFTYSGR